MDFFGNDELEIIRFRKHWIFVVIPVLLLPLLFYSVLRWYFDVLILTNQAFYVRFGLISREVKRIPLRNIQDISFRQGFWGRIFSFGEVLVSSAAIGGMAGYSGIANPKEMVLSISQAIQASNQIQVQIPSQPPFNQNQPPFNQNQPPFNQNQPPFNQNQPPFNQNQPPFNQNQPPFNQNQPPSNENQPPSNANQ